MTDQQKKPNVLILMCDQMQAKKMGFVDGIAHTPNLDALASEGVYFTNAITVHGQCCPSRCAFATGMSPHESNVMTNFGFGDHCGFLTAKNRTFFQEFQDAGYTTAHFGKSHLGSPLRDLGFDVGECLDGHFSEGKEPIERVRRREELAAADEDPIIKGAHHGYVKAGLDWLRRYEPSENPLFFMLDTNLPHPPLYWEEEWQDRFKPEEMALPRSYYEEKFEGKPAFLKERYLKEGKPLKDEEATKLETAQYYSLIAAVDKACGQFIDLFKEKGLWENTTVLFLSDHGEMLGGHGIARKGCMPYEELYNIPCIMRLPEGMERRRAVVEESIISTDLPGALLDVAGLEAAPQFGGSRVTEALGREAPKGDEIVFFEHYAAWWGRHPFYAARTQTMKYVRYYGDDDFEELYDLEKDPDELHNLVGGPDYAKVHADLTKHADNWWTSTGGREADYYETEEFKTNLNACEPA
ncbi:MAG: sulfatase-like hydrolase/transferase [Candidatus Brocadiia bacterium]|jgi:arylsulfatase A-like enzyme|nr:sulfatase-like hydrolase/transferase [Candidatus Brocadiia bacterium]